MVRSQVRRGRPGRRLQSLGNPRIDVYRALDVSCDSPVLFVLCKYLTDIDIDVRQGSLLGWFDIERPAPVDCDVDRPASGDVGPSGTDAASRPYLAPGCAADCFDMETHLVSIPVAIRFITIPEMHHNNVS